MNPLLALIIQNYGRYTAADIMGVAAVFEIGRVSTVGHVSAWVRMLIVLDQCHLNYDLQESLKK
jgi:hypothetical protein